jgi:hypothetical protein
VNNIKKIFNNVSSLIIKSRFLAFIKKIIYKIRNNRCLNEEDFFFINLLILFSILGILGLLFFNYFFLDYNYILNNNLSLISKIKYVHLIHGLINSIQLLIFFNLLRLQEKENKKFTFFNSLVAMSLPMPFMGIDGSETSENIVKGILKDTPMLEDGNHLSQDRLNNYEILDDLGEETPDKRKDKNYPQGFLSLNENIVIDSPCTEDPQETSDKKLKKKSVKFDNNPDIKTFEFKENEKQDKVLTINYIKSNLAENVRKRSIEKKLEFDKNYINESIRTDKINYKRMAKLEQINTYPQGKEILVTLKKKFVFTDFFVEKFYIKPVLGVNSDPVINSNLINSNKDMFKFNKGSRENLEKFMPYLRGQVNKK